MISVRLASQASKYGKKFYVAIFSDAIINVKVCMMAVLVELYPLVFETLSVTLIVF